MKTVTIIDLPTVHTVENWKSYNYTPPKEIQKVEVIQIKTDCEMKLDELYHSFKISLKHWAMTCSWF